MMFDPSVMDGIETVSFTINFPPRSYTLMCVKIQRGITLTTKPNVYYFSSKLQKQHIN